jgi:hypothetical protein
VPDPQGDPRAAKKYADANGGPRLALSVCVGLRLHECRREDRQLGDTSATLIGAALTTAQGNSLPHNLPSPILFSMTSQTMAEARDHSASVGSSVVAIVANESPEFRTVICAAPPGLRESEVIAFASAKNVLVYTVVSTKLINGSPFNSISVVPAGIR